MADDAGALASLSLTHVYYDPDDLLSLGCAYLALLPQALCIVYATLILTTREAEVLLMFAGQMSCELLNFILKRVLKEGRPPQMYGKGYGMPSSHSQFMAFWSVSVALFLLLRHRPVVAAKIVPRKGSKSAEKGGNGGPWGWIETYWGDVDRPWSIIERTLLSVGAAALAAVTAWSRFYLNYHTPRQVFAGFGVGVATALVWFIVVAVVRRTGWLTWALDLPPARMLRIRDLVVEEDISTAGWQRWEEKRSKPNSPSKGAKAKSG